MKAIGWLIFFVLMVLGIYDTLTHDLLRAIHCDTCAILTVLIFKLNKE